MIYGVNCVGGAQEVCGSRYLAARVHNGIYTNTAEERDGSSP